MPVFSQENKKIYVIGVENVNNYPLYYIDKNEEFRGIFRELFDDFARSAKLQFIYRPLRRSQIFKYLYSGKIDLKFPDNPVWSAVEKRQYDIKYSDKIYYYLEGIFVIKENLGKSIDSHKVIGINTDFITWSLVGHVENNDIKILKDSRCSDFIERLLNNNVDGIYCNFFVMRNSLRERNLEEKILFDFKLPTLDDYYYLSTINYQNLLMKFNSWLIENKDIFHEKIKKLIW